MEIGGMYTMVQAMYEEAGGGTGTEIVDNRPFNYPESELFSSQYRSGQYFYKIHKAGNRLPWWLKPFIGGARADLHEETWNSSPYSFSILTLPNLFPGKMYGEVKDMTVAGDDVEKFDTDNIFNLTEDDLKRREIVNIDLAYDMYENYDEMIQLS
eukprot:TRINITY_DN17088_c0_g1_i1.p1 TRINITY_DN17088_c0_g1~~TRINITY_DN17088_c0_g1_i1.p1  ORF type:complete len:155 (-),score=52.32 TRINITY_DN17088_c0_g1_i1:98-562(-)